jgi:putative membrane-bound dehydrogenase-like protein
MNFKLSVALFALLIGSATVFAQQPPAPVTLRVPEGFEVVRVATAPLLAFPVMGGFDDRGRLFVAENIGVNLDAKALEAQLPNRVSVLEDMDGDGVFDRSQVFADKLTFPEGVQWHDGALYVASAPGIWRLEDTDGDGRADVRKQIATGFNSTGNAADVHGPFLHPNGRLYWGHGRKGHEVYQADGTLVSKNLGARIWSCRPDGSDIQVHAGGGLDNPCEVTFNQEGDIFGTANIFNVNPRSDAVVHWVHGGVYARPDQEKVMAEFKHTGDLLPPVAFLGHVAPAGIQYLRGNTWGPEYRDNVFLAQFNTRRIMRVALQRDGSSFRGQPEIFATSADPMVHFTDVIEDADGSLLVIDTGAWFRIGCPTSGAPRTDVAGGIYRIRRKGAPRIDDPRGQQIAWTRLSAEQGTKLLADARPAVRDRALTFVARQGDAAVHALANALGAADALMRSNAVWALTRIGTPAAAAAVRRALGDADPAVRQVACQSAFITQDIAAGPRLMPLLSDAAPAVRREAARALGRLKDVAALPALLAAAGVSGNDAPLEHALIFALFEIGHPELVREHVKAAAWGTRRAALITLDQTAPEMVPADTVFGALRSRDSSLRTAALRIATKRPQWASRVPDYLASAFAGRDAGLAEGGAQMLNAFIGTPETRDWLRTQLSAPESNRAVPDRVIVDAMAAARTAWDDSWRDFLLGALKSRDNELADAALHAVDVHREHGFGAALTELSHDRTRPPAFRVAALQIAAGGGGLDDESFRMLLDPFVTGGTPASRQQAAAVLAQAKLSRDQLIELAGRLRNAGPVELPQLVRSYQRAPADSKIADALIDGLRNSPVRWSLQPDDIYAALRRFPAPAMDSAAPLLTELLEQRAMTEARVAELEKLVAGGDPARGAEAFASGAGSCVSCHRIKDTGAMVGPDLSQIGRIRSTRDLLESIAFPSATIARGYETFRVETAKGESLAGTIVRELSDQVVLGSFDGREIPVARAQITKLEPVATSLMPQGLDRALDPAVLADLVAFLKGLQ